MNSTDSVGAALYGLFLVTFGCVFTAAATGSWLVLLCVPLTGWVILPLAKWLDG
jgi:hypothetical protein